MRKLEEILPAWVADELEPSMILDRLVELRASVIEPVAYQCFEAERERFAWLRDPSGLVRDVNQLVGPRSTTIRGLVHWTLFLRRRRTGWRVEKALTWDSIDAARLAAGMEWAGRAGFLVGFLGGSPGRRAVHN
jgi:hypothetical protein